MISAVSWVKKGVANSAPSRYIPSSTFDEEEAEIQEDSDDIEIQDAETMEINKKYNLDNYDEEDDLINFSAPTFFKPGEKDPLLVDEGEDEEDLDDVIIRPTDAILLAAATEDDQFSHVNVYIYEEEYSNLYVHHDIILPSFPLCIEWMEFYPQDPKVEQNPLLKTGYNTLAIGTFNPEIEIWDLNLMDALTPITALGGHEEHNELESEISNYAQSSQASRKKKKKQLMKKAAQKKLKKGSHSDAVMSLSWNSSVKNILASGSADNTIKLWDMNTQECLNTYTHHAGKVQALSWHAADPHLLLSAAFDKSAVLVDIRSPTEVLRWKLSADVEKVEWNSFHPQEFFVSTEDGFVTCYDSLSPKNTAFTLQAHTGAVGGLSINKKVPNCLATASDDKSLKVWDFTDHKPSLVYSNDSMNTPLFTLSWERDSATILALGGKDHIQVVDLGKIESYTSHFGINK